MGSETRKCSEELSIKLKGLADSLEHNIPNSDVKEEEIKNTLEAVKMAGHAVAHKNAALELAQDYMEKHAALVHELAVAIKVGNTERQTKALATIKKSIAPGQAHDEILAQVVATTQENFELLAKPGFSETVMNLASQTVSGVTKLVVRETIAAATTGLPPGATSTLAAATKLTGLSA